MSIYRRFVEIVQLLGAGRFFQAPTQADMANPEERAALDKYLRGRPGVSAAERISLFKLAWDTSSGVSGQCSSAMPSEVGWRRPLQHGSRSA